MTHDPMALIVAAPMLLVAVYFGWTGFRQTLHPTADTEETTP